MGPGALGLALEVVPPAPTPAAGTTALAPGFRFHPTDEELVGYYLKRKVHGKGFHIEAIAEVDIYKSEPWELADKSMLKSKDQEWYFFSALDKKYGNGARMNRATNNGYWKATGNDRAIRNNSNLVGMKKTLVFHSGRAPDGKRTDWVMHEYRLVDEELEKMGAMQDSYVLCRVFLKNGLGPPKKHRYAPFVEEEWDNGAGTLVPGEAVGDEVPAGDESNDVEEDTQSINEAAHCLADLRKDSKAVLHTCKRERLNGCPLTCEMNQEAASPCMLNREASPPCNANREAAAPLLQYKRRRHGDLDLNNSNTALTRTIQNPCLSTTATPAAATTTTSSATTPPNLPSALLEFSLLDTIQHKESTSDPSPIFAAADLDSSVPSSYWTFMNSLLTEVHKISVERETLKVKLMSAHAMIKILQSQVKSSKKENGDLKRIIEDVSK